MSRVDFAYGASHTLRMACSTTVKHVQAGHKIIVYCLNSNRLQKYSSMLWDYAPTSFISNCFAHDELADYADVLLVDSASNFDLVQHRDWLINLDKDCPPNPTQFNRILEIVSTKPEETESARTRWANYKKLGIQLKAHKLGA